MSDRGDVPEGLDDHEGHLLAPVRSKNHSLQVVGDDSLEIIDLLDESELAEPAETTLPVGILLSLITQEQQQQQQQQQDTASPLNGDTETDACGGDVRTTIAVSPTDNADGDTDTDPEQDIMLASTIVDENDREHLNWPQIPPVDLFLHVRHSARSTCSLCNNIDVRICDKFCSQCGTEVDAITRIQLAEQVAPYCNCGAALSLQDRFCAACGTDVDPINMGTSKPIHFVPVTIPEANRTKSKQSTRMKSRDGDCDGKDPSMHSSTLTTTTISSTEPRSTSPELDVPTISGGVFEWLDRKISPHRTVPERPDSSSGEMSSGGFLSEHVDDKSAITKDNLIHDTDTLVAVSDDLVGEASHFYNSVSELLQNPTADANTPSDDSTKSNSESRANSESRSSPEDSQLIEELSGLKQQNEDLQSLLNVIRDEKTEERFNRRGDITRGHHFQESLPPPEPPIFDWEDATSIEYPTRLSKALAHNESSAVPPQKKALQDPIRSLKATTQKLLNHHAQRVERAAERSSRSMSQSRNLIQVEQTQEKSGGTTGELFTPENAEVLKKEVLLSCTRSPLAKSLCSAEGLAVIAKTAVDAAMDPNESLTDKIPRIKKAISSTFRDSVDADGAIVNNESVRELILWTTLRKIQGLQTQAGIRSPANHEDLSEEIDVIAKSFESLRKLKEEASDSSANPRNSSTLLGTNVSLTDNDPESQFLHPLQDSIVSSATAVGIHTAAVTVGSSLGEIKISKPSIESGLDEGSDPSIDSSNEVTRPIKKRVRSPYWLHSCNSNGLKKERLGALFAKAGLSLEDDGNFLIREWVNHSPPEAVDCILSVVFKGRFTHHRIDKTPEGYMRVNGKTVYKPHTTLERLLLAFSNGPEHPWPVPLVHGVSRSGTSFDAETTFVAAVGCPLPIKPIVIDKKNVLETSNTRDEKSALRLVEIRNQMDSIKAQVKQLHSDLTDTTTDSKKAEDLVAISSLASRIDATAKQALGLSSIPNRSLKSDKIVANSLPVEGVAGSVEVDEINASKVKDSSDFSVRRSSATKSKSMERNSESPNDKSSSNGPGRNQGQTYQERGGRGGGDTVLHVACAGGQHEIVKILLKEGCTKDVRTESDGGTPLMRCCEAGGKQPEGYGRSRSKVSKSSNASDDGVNKVKLYFECACELVDAGHDIHIQNHRGENALHVAFQYRQVEIADMLIRHGARPCSKKCQKCALNMKIRSRAKSSMGKTVVAAQLQTKDAVQQVIDEEFGNVDFMQELNRMKLETGLAGSSKFGNRSNRKSIGDESETVTSDGVSLSSSAEVDLSKKTGKKKKKKKKKKAGNS